jgi:hypothetical protein
MPAGTFDCPAVLEDDFCDDGDDETMDDVCTSDGCHGKKKLSSSLTFDVSPTIPTGAALVALKDDIKTAIATTLVSTMSSVTPGDVVVNSVVAGSTVVDYVVAVPAAEATTESQEAAVSALGSSPTLASVEIDGSAAGTATPEVFVVYSWIKTAALCPADCGLAASTLPDIYACQADGSLALDVDCLLNIGGKPSSSAACQATAPCVTYTWYADVFATCPEQCGMAESTLTRTVICLGSDGSTAASEALCDGTKPGGTASCPATDECVTYDWTVTTSWSPAACPDATCGTVETVQTRNVECVDNSGNRVSDVWATVRCSGAMPSSVNVCVATPDCEAFSWSAGTWSGACPTDCGSAASTLSRTVTCLDESTGAVAVHESSCVETKPAAQDACPQTDDCVPQSGAVTASLSLDIDIDSIAAGTPERAAFEASFRTDVATVLGIAEERVLLLSVASGSVVVTFAVDPSPAGVAIAPAEFDFALGADSLEIAGVSVETFSVTTPPSPLPGLDAEEQADDDDDDDDDDDEQERAVVDPSLAAEVEGSDAVSREEMLLIIVAAAAGFTSCVCLALAIVCCVHLSRSKGGAKQQPVAQQVVIPTAARYAIDDEDPPGLLSPSVVGERAQMLPPLPSQQQQQQQQQGQFFPKHDRPAAKVPL